MKTNARNRIKNTLIPCILFSGITGVVTGSAIFVFKLLANYIVCISSDIYGFVRKNPVWLPVLIGGGILAGLLASLLLHIEPNARGGGIPTSIAILRGMLDFSWLKNILIIFPSAMLTYLCGVPLGNEGPSVMIGTAVGRGAVSIFGKRKKAWNRYIMTGGACAGFAAATSAPLSGIFFAFEEAHRRLSPMIFMSAATTVISGMTTVNFLSVLSGESISFFDFTINEVLPIKNLWVPVLVGIVCGIAALFFTKIYRLLGTLINSRLEKIPFTFKVSAVFGAVTVFGFLWSSSIGTGHSLIEELIKNQGIWYMLIVFFLVRSFFFITANNIGITGGLFVPTLAFGAIIGAICGNIMVKTGALAQEYYSIVVTIGMVAFMSASSRTPITAITFGAEALCGFSNILPLIIGAGISFLVIETMGEEAFCDTVITSKLSRENDGKTDKVIDESFVVNKGSFAQGREIRDILWPPTGKVLTHRKNSSRQSDAHIIDEGDILHIHCHTYNEEYTRQKLEELLGEQNGETKGGDRLTDV